MTEGHWKLEKVFRDISGASNYVYRWSGEGITRLRYESKPLELTTEEAKLLEGKIEALREAFNRDPPASHEGPKSPPDTKEKTR